MTPWVRPDPECGPESTRPEWRSRPAAVPRFATESQDGTSVPIDPTTATLQDRGTGSQYRIPGTGLGAGYPREPFQSVSYVYMCPSLGYDCNRRRYTNRWFGTSEPVAGSRSRPVVCLQPSSRIDRHERNRSGSKPNEMIGIDSLYGRSRGGSGVEGARSSDRIPARNETQRVTARTTGDPRSTAERRPQRPDDRSPSSEIHP